MSDVQQYLDQIQVGGEPPVVARRGRMPHPAAQALILKALEADPEWAHIDLGDSKTADARIPYLRKHKFEAAVRDTSVVWVRVTEETMVPSWVNGA